MRRTRAEAERLSAELELGAKLRVHPTLDGLALRVEGRVPLVIRDVPRLQLPAFVGHLTAFIPSSTPVTPPVISPTTSPITSPIGATS